MQVRVSDVARASDPVPAAPPAATRPPPIEDLDDPECQICFNDVLDEPEQRARLSCGCPTSVLICNRCAYRHLVRQNTNSCPWCRQPVLEVSRIVEATWRPMYRFNEAFERWASA